MGGFTGMLGGGAPAPTIIQAAPPPSRSDVDVRAAGEAERRRKRAMIGRQSTNLTGDEGVTETANVARPTLLGGASQATGA